MTTPIISILISSFKRLPYFRRTLYSIAANPPNVHFEVVISEELNEETPQILNELKKYSFDWCFVTHDITKFEEATGLKKYHNSPVLSYNLGFKQCRGDFICMMGNDIIVGPNAFNNLLNTKIGAENYIVYSTTINCPQWILSEIGEYGENLSIFHIHQSGPVLQSPQIRSGVNNYLSLTPKSTINKIKGWNTLYLQSIAAEDSCFTRRIKTIPNSIECYMDNAISLHQDHPSPRGSAFWDEGVRIARERYHNWDGKYYLEQEWPISDIGLKDVIKNYQ